MGNVRFSGGRKTVIILLLILFLVVGGSGGYLLWRTNQEKIVAPTESEAGGGGNVPYGCCICPDNNEKTSECNGHQGYIPYCICSDGGFCPSLPPCTGSGKNCNTPCCVWPYVAWWVQDIGEGNCACAHRTKKYPKDRSLECHDTLPRCTPAACPTGYIDMHVPGGGTMFEPTNYSAVDLALIEAANLFHHNTRMLCSENPNAELCYTQCQARCDPCENTYCVRRMCKKAPPAPTCGDGNVDSGEQCDPPGSKCSNGQICTSDCKCPATPTCGDGNVDTGLGEQCDPPGSKCSNGQTCTSDCKCPTPPAAICDGKGKGSAITFNPSPENLIFNKGSKFTYSYTIGDSVGIDLSSVQVQVSNTVLNGSVHPQPVITPNTGTPKTATVSGELNNTVPLYVGKDKPIIIRWKRVGEANYNTEKCEVRRTFTINECDGVGKKWEVMPPTTIVEGKTVPFKYITGDTDGVRHTATDPKVLLNGVDVSGVTRIPSSTNSPNVTVSGTLSGLTPSATPYKLEIIWNDIYGAGGTTCYAYTTIKVNEAPAVPTNWDIDKLATEECIDDGTANPKSKITNTITIRNTGSAAGGLKQIVDTLDEKVNTSTISGVNPAYTKLEGRNITWTFTPPAVYASGQSKSFTYSYIVEKDKFGIYRNTAIGTSVADNTFQAGASIEARCNVVSLSCGDGKVDTELGEQCDPPGSACTDVYGNASVCTDLCACPADTPTPQTGIFDESRNIVLLGAILLFTGLGWTWITSSYRVLEKKAKAESKSRFERRVVK